MHAYAVMCLHEYLAYALVLTVLTTKSLDVLHSFLPQPLNILDIVLSHSPISQIGQSVSVIGGRGTNGRASTLACK